MQSIKGRILCTEDDVDTRELIALALTQSGYEVVCASNVFKTAEEPWKFEDQNVRQNNHENTNFNH